MLGEQWFFTRLEASHPLSDAARAAAAQESDLAEEQAPGLVVVSQTCDIVRSCASRPFVEVCPLVEVSDAGFSEIASGRRPAYAMVPGLAAKRLVADLDRTMTLEKPIVARWSRVPGCTTDQEARDLAQALARKRARFAFPDDFTALAKKLQGRIGDKHDKNSDEGRALRSLREIRVQAAPSWGASSVTLFLWFIRHDVDADFEGKSWASLLASWLKLIPSSGRFVEVDGLVATLADMRADEYVGSDRLDLDHLSLGGTVK